jgi:hypothetical protein
MLGRTRLYQRTGSPLIQGRPGVKRRGKLWPWLLLAVVVALLVWAYPVFVK